MYWSYKYKTRKSKAERANGQPLHVDEIAVTARIENAMNEDNIAL